MLHRLLRHDFFEMRNLFLDQAANQGAKRLIDKNKTAK